PQPPPQPVKLTHNGRADQAIALIAWPTSDFPSNPQAAREERVLEKVMELRMIDRLRIEQAVTYSPSTRLESSWDFPGYGYISAQIEAPPDKLDGFYATTSGIAQELRDKPITADE